MSKKNISYEQAIKLGLISAEDIPKEIRKKIKKPSSKDVEGQEQAELIKIFRKTYPEIGGLLIHIPNGGSRKNAYEGWRLKEQGVRAGVSDLFLPVPKKQYHGLWIEFKATPPFNAAVSKEQKEWIGQMQIQGYQARICLGLKEAMDCLNEYLR